MLETQKNSFDDQILETILAKNNKKMLDMLIPKYSQPILVHHRANEFIQILYAMKEHIPQEEFDAMLKQIQQIQQSDLTTKDTLQAKEEYNKLLSENQHNFSVLISNAIVNASKRASI